MINNFFSKVLAPTAIGTVIGFSSILSTISSAAAFDGTIQTPVKNAISHVVLYLQDGDGNITAVKVDNFSNVSDDIKEYDPKGFLASEYPNSQLVAYEVKAGRDKYPTLLSIDKLPQFKNSEIKAIDYKVVKDISIPQSQEPAPNPVLEEPTPTPVVEEAPAPTPVVQEPDIQPGRNTYALAQEPSPKKVKVPEPGSMAAIAIFGLGGLVAKKKVSS
ncbi:MAG: hypothetical protein VKN72_28585 [Nostocales cyanobacterium 94392]|nr:hypothetical protein [Nostocales cyanobacterium 94392]